LQTVVFLLYHGMGHFNACFRLAKILQRDYHVVFAGFGSFKKYIESQGFIYYSLTTVPFGLGFEEWVNEQAKHRLIYFRNAHDRWADRLYQARRTELYQMVNDVSPDYLLIDSYQSTDFIVLYSYLKERSVKVCLIQTGLPTIINRKCPPPSSSASPNNSLEIKHGHRNFDFSLFKKRLKQKLMFFGKDDLAIIKRRLKRNKLPAHYLSAERTWRGIAFKNIQELVLAPKEFDFEQNARKFSHYIGFMPALTRVEISDVEYFKIDFSIRNKLKENNGVLLYCSFGSVDTHSTRKILIFINKLIAAIRDQNCILIISAYTTYNQIDPKDIPENVFVLKAAPQLEILKRADVFITHGGINSIKEAVYAGVPMLVYPFDITTDRIGNASRVFHYKLGLQGDLVNDSVDDVVHKISELINDDVYKKNIYALREKDILYEEKFIEHFKNIEPVS